MKTMKAIFKGKNNSCGFETGKEYNIYTSVNGGYLWLIVLEKNLSCPYSSLENLLKNWTITELDNPNKIISI
jgi:hypothetical protein